MATLTADEHKKHATIKRDGGKFPIPDKGHARAALARLNQSDLSPAEKEKVKRAARAKLAEGGIEDADFAYFDDGRLDWLQDVAALQEAESHFDPKQPRGRTGQWIKKLQAASTPAARRELVSQHIHADGDPGNNAEAAMVFHEIADAEGDDFVKATLKSIGHRIETEEHAKPLFAKAKAAVAKGEMLPGKTHFDAATAEQARIDKRWGKDPNEPHGFRVKGSGAPATGEPHLVHQLEPGTTFLHPTTGKLLRVKSHAMIPRPGQHLPKRTTKATHVSDGSPATLDGHTLVTPSKYRTDPDTAEISGYVSAVQYGSGTRPNLAGWSPEALKRYHEALFDDDENYEDPDATAGFDAERKRVEAALKKLQEGAMTDLDWDARAREVLAEADGETLHDFDTEDAAAAFLVRQDDGTMQEAETAADRVLHPRDRRGQWQKKLAGMKVGDRMKLGGHTVHRTEKGWQVRHRSRRGGDFLGFGAETPGEAARAVEITRENRAAGDAARRKANAAAGDAARRATHDAPLKPGHKRAGDLKPGDVIDDVRPRKKTEQALVVTHHDDRGRVHVRDNESRFTLHPKEQVKHTGGNYQPRGSVREAGKHRAEWGVEGGVEDHLRSHPEHAEEMEHHARKALQDARKEGDTQGIERISRNLSAIQKHRRKVKEAALSEVSLSEVSSSSLPDLPNKPDKTNWVEKAGGLPRYIERIAKHLHSEKGMDVSRAIATAVNVVKRMCASGDTNFPGKQSVNAKSRAQACAAVADWERKKVSHAATDDRQVAGALRLLEAHAVSPVFSGAIEEIAAEIMADDEAVAEGLQEAARREYVRNRRGQFATLFKAAAESGTVPRQARPDARRLPKK